MTPDLLYTDGATGMAGMLGFRTLLVGNFPIGIIHILCLVRLYIPKVHLHYLRILIILFEFGSCLWYGVIPQIGTSVIILLHRPSQRIRHRDKEVGRGLAIGRNITHIDEILPSKVDRTKIDHSSFVDKANFIESIIKRLSGLIYRNDGGIMSEICGDSEAGTNSRAVLESRPRVELKNQLRSTPQTVL